jgi:CRISPR-associated endonuclease Csn1
MRCARALDEALEPHEIGRALFHLNQRRGFQSNRKAERKQKDGDGKIAPAADRLDRAMQNKGARTLGQFLFLRQQEKDEHGRPDPKPARIRMGSDSQEYDFYPLRRHVEAEFDAIWDKQATYHPDLLTDKAKAALRRILFFQRPLKQPEVGVCTFFNHERRLAKAHPLFQERRLYEEVNQLQITTPGEAGRPLDRDQRDRLVLQLRGKRKVSFASLARTLKLQPGQSFNKASETRTDLAGNEVYAALADKKRFGEGGWAHRSPEQQWLIIDRLLEEEDPDALHAFLLEQGLDEEHARTTADVALPEGYGRLGETATRLILEEHRKDVITYDEAVRRALGKHHSDDRTGEVLPRLPYYGELLTRDIPPGSQRESDPPEIRWGKITNPTVHIGLRQVEKVVNAVIDRHGRPELIVVELARELKLNEGDKEEHNRRIRKDTADAQRRSRILLGLDASGNRVGDPIARDTGANRARMKLWEELNPANPLDRRCPYCGDRNPPIGIATLFSDAVDIDHIIPYSRSLDDSAANKVVAHRSCNRDKGNKTPFERWGTDPDRWDRISVQVARLHRSKQWRFGPEAMERFGGEQGFLARQLTDTQYLSRLAGKYLRSLYPTKEAGRVYVIPGRMTAMLRRLWALNDVLADKDFVENKNSNAPKNRLDHRHHAIDAFVCAVTSEALLQKIAYAARRAVDHDLDRMFEGLPEPWPGYLPELHDRLSKVVTSHKPDHGRKGRPSPHRDVTAGRLHNDTAYGFTGQVAADGKTPIVVHRVPLSSLKPADLTDPARIADPILREELIAATRGRDWQAALKAIRDHGVERQDVNGRPLFKGLRHVRVREPLNVVAVRDAAGKPYKAYKGDANARFDVWQLPGGKWVTSWKDRDGVERSGIVSMFDAHQSETRPRPHPAAKKVLSLRQNDLLAIERDGPPEIVRVVKFSMIGAIALAPANEGGPLKARDADKGDPFRYIYSSGGGLKKLKARQIRIDPLGRILDPGPR